MRRIFQSVCLLFRFSAWVVWHWLGATTLALGLFLVGYQFTFVGWRSGVVALGIWLAVFAVVLFIDNWILSSRNKARDD